MAKHKVGDEVRLKRTMQFGNVSLRKTTKGEIKSISGSFSKKYDIMWDGTSFPITMLGDKDFVNIEDD